MLTHVLKEQDRLRELKRAQTDSWYLAGKLNYHWNPKAGKGLFKGKGLTERLHMQLMRHFYDAQRDVPALWLELARFHHKTTMFVCLMIQEILRDPNVVQMYFHNVYGKADEVVREAAHHIQHNPYLRSLEPIGKYTDEWVAQFRERHPDQEPPRHYNVLPPQTQKNFCASSKGVTEFRVNRERFSRFGSIIGAGVLTESVGVHCNIAWLDDIIGRMTVRNGQVGEVQHWYESMLVPVVDDGVFRGIGTPWCDFGPYMHWRVEDSWKSLVIPGCVSVPDPENPVAHLDFSQKHIIVDRQDDIEKGTPTYGPAEKIEQSLKRLVWLRGQMKANFDPQIQLNPSPTSEKPWSADCEHYISAKDAFAKGGFLVALSDPAPANMESQHEPSSVKDENDIEKDDWAHAVVLIRANGMRQEIILIDGSHDPMWDDDAGWRALCTLQRKYSVSHVGIEGVGGTLAKYQKDHGSACVKNGALADHIKFRTTYIGKNQRFSHLAAKAKRTEFFICKETLEASPEGRAFLEAFLDQARRWRPTGKRTGLRHDDCADVVSYATDPEVLELSPMVEDQAEINEMLGDDEDDDFLDSPCLHIEI